MLHRTSMLTSPITDLKGVGAKMAERLQKIGIVSIEDMLFHLPTRYEDRTRLHFLNQLIPGDHVSFIATVEHCEITNGRRRMLLCHVSDDFGRATLLFFNFGELDLCFLGLVKLNLVFDNKSSCIIFKAS